MCSWDAERPTADWNELAAEIERRLASPELAVSAAPAISSGQRLRDALTELLARALHNAGRDDDVVRLYEREAETTGSYPRLVRHLLDLGDLERAEYWARRGITATPTQVYGVTGQLRRALRTIAERQGDLARVAAFDAYEFFAQPSVRSFQALLASAEAAGQRGPVRHHALRYLETLTLPWHRPAASDAAPEPTARPAAESGMPTPSASAELPPWPLPSTGLPDPAPYGREQPPLARVLLDIALAENRVDDVLVWFDRLRQQQRPYGYYYGDPSASVARAVEGSHPDRAVAIWEDLAARAVALTKTEAYLDAARYLEQAGRIEERRGNLAAWRSRIQALQTRERRKWRLRETLDALLARFPPP